MKPLFILKNRSDIGAGTRGSDMGIDALEIAAINAKNDFFNKHPFEDIKTHNETVYDKVKNTTAVASLKRLSPSSSTFKRLGAFVFSSEAIIAAGSVAESNMPANNAVIQGKPTGWPIAK